MSACNPCLRGRHIRCEVIGCTCSTCSFARGKRAVTATRRRPGPKPGTRRPSKPRAPRPKRTDAIGWHYIPRGGSKELDDFIAEQVLALLKHMESMWVLPTEQSEVEHGT